MNLQSMTIIFVIIFLPIILISTYYIQREVDTITLQTSYDTKLIDATTDAVSAFEINTANEDLSSVSDSLRSIIEASNNVFTTTLATNLGMSGATKSKILPYIPAIVYTLYDGYYIYSPTKQAKVLTDPNGVYVRVGDPGVNKGSNGVYVYDYIAVKGCDNDQEALEKLKEENINNPEEYGKILYFSKSSDGKTEDNTIKCTIYPDEFEDDDKSAYFTTSYILKSFIPYAMQYKWDNNDITINYTLDNYITVYGTINGVYYSKSGYLINYETLKYVNDESAEVFCAQYSENEIDNLVNSTAENAIVLKFDTNGDGDIDIEIDSKDDSAKSEHYSGNEISDNESAIEYYLKSYIFSKWVHDNLNDIESEDVKSNILQQGFSIKQNGENLEENATLFWDYTEEFIFKTMNDDGDLVWNVENSESNFYEHKRKVIKNSIQYTLNQAMATYNQGQGDEYYQMPLLSEPEWDKLLSNVSVLAFMQGMPCGLKTYNNYALVTSSNNEIMANVEEIYYVPFTGDYLLDEALKSDWAYGDSWKEGFTTGTIGVFSTEQKNKIMKKFLGNLQEGTEVYKDAVRTASEFISGITLSTAHRIDCTDLIGDNSVKYYESFPSREIKYDKKYNSNTRNYEYDHVCNMCYDCIVNSNYIADISTNDNLNKAELIAIAKIRNNTYKSCAVKTNNGIFVDDDPDDTNNEVFQYSLKNVSMCYEIQVTIKNADDQGIYGRNKIYLGDEESTYNCENNNTQTIIFDESENWKVGNLTVAPKASGKQPTIDIVSITYKYK